MSLSVSDLTGDAFRGDRKNHQVFGVDISTRDSTVSLNADAGLPESKCNTVSLVKAESSTTEFRNMLASTDCYVCYAVRRNLLRLINTKSGEKTLLRGHKSIIADMKFSICSEQQQLCTVDVGFDSMDSSDAHTFVWTIEGGDKSLAAAIVCQLPLISTVVQPHPRYSELWAIAGSSSGANGAIGIISSVDCNANNSPSYDKLSMHDILPNEIVSDLSFTYDGSMLVAVVRPIGAVNHSQQTAVVAWKVNYVPGQSNSYSEARLSIAFRFGVSNAVAVSCPFTGILVASLIDSTGSKNAGNILLQCWPILMTDKAGAVTTSRAPVQSVVVELPLYRGELVPFVNEKAQFPSAASGVFQYLEATLAVSGTTPPFVVVSHRKSNYVACLEVDHVSLSYRGHHGDRFPISHATLLDLKSPVESVGYSMIASQDHHSDDIAMHLEVVCYQPQEGSGQCGVQQYHVLEGQLHRIGVARPTSSQHTETFSASVSAAAPATLSASVVAASATVASAPAVEDYSKSSIESLLASLTGSSHMSSSSASSSLTSASSTAFSANSDLMGLLAPSSMKASLPSPSSYMAAPLKSVEESKVAEQDGSGKQLGADTFALPQSPAAIGNVSLLNMIKSNKQKTAPVSSQPDDTGRNKAGVASASAKPLAPMPASPAPPAAPVAAPVPSPRQAAPTAAPAPVAAPVPSPRVTAPAPLAAAATGPVPSSKVAAAAPAQALASVPVAAPVPSPRVATPATASAPAPSPKASTPASAPAPAPAPVPSSKASTPARAPAPAPAPAPAAGPAPQGRSIMEMFKTSVTPSDVAVVVVAEAAHETPSTGPINTIIAETSIVNTPYVPASASASESISASSIDIEALSGKVSAEVTKSVAGMMKTGLNDISRASSASVNQGYQSAAVAMKKTVETEIKKGFEKSFTPGTVADELAKLLRDKLTDVIQERMAAESAIASSFVRETLKSEIVSAFRTAFETALVPAYQAGADRMFQQMQQTFEAGLAAMATQAAQLHVDNNTTNAAILTEVRQLRKSIHQLEGQVAMLTTQQGQLEQQLKLSVELNEKLVREAGTPVAVLDPIALFKQGRIAESVEAALEKKDVLVLVRLLEQFTGPSQLSSSCSGFIQLCTIQQLAADFSSNTPAEGITMRLSWLKTLVMGLLFSATPTDIDHTTQLLPVMAGVLGFLRQAESRLSTIAPSAAVDTGDDEDASRKLVSSADLTDLRMLIALMGHKF